MTPAEILKAAADLIEYHPGAHHYTAHQAIEHVTAADDLSRLDAVTAFSRFLRANGMDSVWQASATRVAIIAALRQACEEAS